MKKLLSLSFLAIFSLSMVFAQTNPSSETVSIDDQSAVIKFDETSHDYGTIEQNANGKYDFVFKNEGNVPLVLSNVRSSCGCTIPQWPREPIAPGATSTIEVKYDTRRIGTFSKSITVTSNGSETPILLRIKGKVITKADAAAN